VHDTVAFEAKGIPSVFVASEEFRQAAIVQSEALGMPGVRRLFVRHPIQDRTDDEMRQLADDAVEAIVAELIE
jgi:hypothetical protein